MEASTGVAAPVIAAQSGAGTFPPGARALGLACCAPVVLLGLFGPWLAPWDPALIVGPPLAAPSTLHWMGTDALGRDLWSAVAHGARASLAVAFAVGAVALAMGAALGTLAGYCGGRIDDALMRVTEFFQVIPRFFLAVLAIALLGPGLDRVILVLGLSSWPLLARVIRAEVLVLKEQEYVSAARVSGASDWRIVTRELLPGALPAALVLLGLLVGQVLLIEASLGFIGLGDPNVITWGGLAGHAHHYLRVAWWLPLFPGAAIAITVLGCNLLVDAATNPEAGLR